MIARPILFSAPMVRAMLDGSKTQTRRVIKPQPRSNGKIFNARAGEIRCEQDNLPPSALLWDVGKHRVTVCDLDGTLQLCCPYGVPGDTLWVKESIQRDEALGQASSFAADCTPTKATEWAWKRKALPGMFMPKVLSRITLEVTGVRVERVQDISEADAVAEGVHAVEVPTCVVQNGYTIPARAAYETLWCDINGAQSWADNPWVWVVEFRRVKP